MDAFNSGQPHVAEYCHGSCSSPEKVDGYTVGEAVRDICSVSITAAPKSSVRYILTRLRSSLIDEAIGKVEDLRIGCTQYGNGCDGDCHACNYDEALDKTLDTLRELKKNP